MHELSQEALRITTELNNSYHSPEEIRTIMEKLTGREIDPSFGLFPPFYTDCGKNIKLGKMSSSTPDADFKTRAASQLTTTL